MANIVYKNIDMSVRWPMSLVQINTEAVDPSEQI